VGGGGEQSGKRSTAFCPEEEEGIVVDLCFFALMTAEIENFVLLFPYISNRSSRENLWKYQLDSSEIMRSILITTQFYKALTSHGEISS